MTDFSREGVSKPPLDFTKIETLRTHCKLTKAEFASLCGVSRMTYYGWLRGRPIRPKNDAFVRRIVRIILMLVSEEKWPEGLDLLSPDERRERLRQLVGP
jgi:transcriptional regulator with XRE-family HTH domain